MRLSQRMARLGTETAFEVLVRARALEAKGWSVVHLEIGEPDFDTPAHISEAAMTALRGGATPEMVVVTPGGKPILFFRHPRSRGRGDEVLYPNTGFPIYESLIRYIGSTPVPVR